MAFPLQDRNLPSETGAGTLKRQRGAALQLYLQHIKSDPSFLKEAECSPELHIHVYSFPLLHVSPLLPAFPSVAGRVVSTGIRSVLVYTVVGAREDKDHA